MLAQLIVSSLSMGSIYALIALAMVMIYKTSEVPNFAQGEIAMIATYVCYMLFSGMGWSFGMALVGSLVSALLLGLAFEFSVLRRAKQPHLLDVILMTLGFQFVLHGFAGWKWGGDQKDFAFPISNDETWQVGNVTLSHLDAATMAVAAIAMLTLFGFLRTKVGTAMKATQQNAMAARINGIRTNRLLSLTWGVSAAVGACAGLLLAPVTTLDPSLMWDPVLKGFAAAVLGGMRSLPGAALGGYLLALIENLFGTYVSTEFRSVVAFSVIVAVLWFRPDGLLGHHYERKV